MKRLAVLLFATLIAALVLLANDDIRTKALAVITGANDPPTQGLTAPSTTALPESEQKAEETAGEVRLTAEQVQLIGLKTAVAEQKPLTVDLVLNGEVNANQDRTVQVLPRAAGIVREVNKTLGDHVRIDDTLAVIESRELAEMVANLFANKSKAELAQKQFEREEGLWQKKVSSEQDYLTAKQAATEAGIELRTAEQRLTLLGLDPKTIAAQPLSNRNAIRVPVTAPLEGSVIEKKVAVGDQVTDQSPLFRIANLERVWVIANVFEKDIGSVTLGQPATVTLRAYPEKKFSGQIVWISDVLDEATRTLKVRVELDNPDRLLKPGSFARVTLKRTINERAVAVPLTAVQRQNKQPIVFVDAGDGLYKRRVVQLGAANGDTTEITNGLTPGEVVVTNGSFLLKSELEKSSFAESD